MSIKNLLLILMVLLLANFARAEDIRMDLISYQPINLMPGTYFNALFEVENLDSENVTDIQFELSTDSSLAVESNSKKNFDVLESNKPIQLNYKIRVNTDASSGYKDLTLSYDNSDSDSEKFSVFVSAIETNLVLGNIKQQELIPGNKGKLTLTLENRANYNVKDIKVMLDLTNVPFAPVNSASEKTISLIGMYGSQDLDFDLIALPTAEAGVYKIPVRIIYFDEFSRQYNITSMISLTVSAYPFLDISIDKNTLIENTKSTVTVKFVNRGLTSIKFLNVKLMNSNFYSILSADNFYIGNVNVDDYQTLDFDLVAKTPGNLILPLMISYKDANNKDYISTVNLNTKVYSQAEAKQLGLIKSSNYSFVFIIIFLIIGLILYFKYRKKR